jgi:hypothetical protein
MFKKFLFLAILALFAPSVWAQTTAVTATVTDAGGVVWKNGSYSFTFLPSPLNPTANYFQNGVPFNKFQVISGNLDATGTVSAVAIPDNLTISPGGSQWKIQFCPLATATNGCYNISMTITGATQNITSSVNPPAIIVNMTNPPPGGSSAYTDGEIFGARVGSFYFNLTDNTPHFCQLPVCTWVPVAGSFTGTIAAGQIGYGGGPNVLTSSPNFLFDAVNNTQTIQNSTGGNGLVLVNPTAANNVLAQPSPILLLRGHSWNGAASVNNDCTLQNQPVNGTNAGQRLTITCVLANTQVDMSADTVTTGALTANGLITTDALDGIVYSGGVTTSISGNLNSAPSILQSAFWNGAANVFSQTKFQDLIGVGATPTTTTQISNTGAFNWAGINLVGALATGKPVSSNGTAAVLSGTGACGTITTQVGGSWAGSAKCTAATAASTLTITFVTTQPNGYVCNVYDETTRANLFQQTSHTTTACVLTATSVTQNDVFVFSAIGF